MNRFLTLIDEMSPQLEHPLIAVATQASQTTQQQVLEEARKAARLRVQGAYLRLNNTHPTHGQSWRQEGLVKARQLIDRSISNIDEVVDKLDTMHTVLSSANRFTTSYTSGECNSRGAYYDSSDRKVHTCPAFFSMSPEERIRTMIHESAHAAGIRESGIESYLVVYDCNTSYNNKNVADGWAHFVHCLMGLPQDPPQTLSNIYTPLAGTKSIPRAQQKNCPQMEETRVDEDEFVLDILQFFFTQRLDANQINDDLRDIAARMVWTATTASRRMDLVPRPPRGVPSFTWLVSEAVQIAFRRANNRCIYEAVRVTTARNFRSAYEIARNQGGGSGSSRGLSSAYTAINYTVPGMVPVLAQPHSKACWATVFMMLYSWKRQQSVSVEETLRALGHKWLTIYENNDGLSGADKPEFVRAAGLIAEPPMSLSIQGWEDMLRNYGPLWLTSNESPGSGWAIHARVLTGIQGDGTSSGTRFKIIDPAGGRQYEETIATFIPKYEDEVRRTGAMRIQILHWPGQGSSSQSHLNGHSYTYASNALNFHVQGVPSISQPSNNTCWAAAITTLFGWYRGNLSLNIHNFLNELNDKTFVNLFDRDVSTNGAHRGINSGEARLLYDILGLETIDQFNPTIEQWEQYLRDFGPLYMNIGFRTGNVYHAVVIKGIEGDGSPGGTRVHVHDPASIISSPIVFQQLIGMYETGAGWPMQIVHFPRGESMISSGKSSAHSGYSNGHQELSPIEINISPARREQILRSAGWKKINMMVTIKNYLGEPLLGHRVFAEFQAPNVAPQTHAAEVQGGSAIFTNIWIKPTGTLRLIAVSTGNPTLAPSGLVQYTLPSGNQLRFDAQQDKRDVEVTATSSQEAASKVGASGSVGVEFQVFSAGGEVSSEESNARGESVSRRYTVRLPASTFIISAL